MARLLLLLLLTTSMWAAQIVGQFSNNECDTLRIAQTKKLLIVGEGDERFRGLKIYDISSPTHPRLLSQYPTELYPSDLALFDNERYVLLLSQAYSNDFTDFESKMEIFDIQNPRKPKKIVERDFDLPAWYCDIYNGIAAITANNFDVETDLFESKLYLVDLSTPSLPSIMVESITPEFAWGVALFNSGDPNKPGGIVAFDTQGLGLFYIKGIGAIRAYRTSVAPLSAIYNTISIHSFDAGEDLLLFSGAFLTREQEETGGLLGILIEYGLLIILDETYFDQALFEVEVSPDYTTFYTFSTTDSLYVVDASKLYSILSVDTIDVEENNNLEPISQNTKRLVNVPKNELILQTLRFPNTESIYRADITSDGHYIYVATDAGAFIVDTRSTNDLISYLLSKGFTKTGTFTRYDFPGVDSAFDWIFVTPSNQVYQLQGNPPTSDNVFGWKRVYVAPTITPNSWNMIYLGDYDHDGDTKFDWVLYQNQNYTTSIYKLDGVAKDGTFLYKKIEGLSANIEGANGEMVFFAIDEPL